MYASKVGCSGTGLKRPLPLSTESKSQRYVHERRVGVAVHADVVVRLLVDDRIGDVVLVELVEEVVLVEGEVEHILQSTASRAKRNQVQRAELKGRPDAFLRDVLSQGPNLNRTLSAN